MNEQIDQKKLNKMKLEILELEKDNLSTKKWTSADMRKNIKEIIIKNSNSHIK